jgi:hypothetical protein
MYIPCFLGVLANPSNPEKMALLKEMQQDYQRIAEYLTERLKAGEKWKFPDFIDHVSTELKLPHAFVGDVMWDILMGQYAITLDVDFIISLYRPIRTPAIGKWDVSALAVM